MAPSLPYASLRAPAPLRETTQPPRLPTAGWPNPMSVQAYRNPLCSFRITFSCGRPPKQTPSVRHQPAAPLALELCASPWTPTYSACTAITLRKCHTQISPMAPHRNLSSCPLSRIFDHADRDAMILDAQHVVQTLRPSASTRQPDHPSGGALPGAASAWLMATYHPSAILRAPDKADRDRKRAKFVDDLHHAAARLYARAH